MNILLFDTQPCFAAGLMAAASKINAAVTLGTVGEGAPGYCEWMASAAVVVIARELYSRKFVGCWNASAPSTPVVVISDSTQLAQLARDVWDGPLSGVVRREEDPEFLVDQIKVIARGGALLTPTAKHYESEAAAAARKPGSARPVLSERELHLLKMRWNGSSFAEIARSINLSVQRVKDIAGEVRAKLDAPSMEVALARAVHYGLLDLERPPQAIEPTAFVSRDSPGLMAATRP